MNTHPNNAPQSVPQSRLSPVWIVIPAAGLGARMASEIPKQYLLLADKTILQVTLEKMLALPELAGVIVAINPNDNYWPTQGFAANTAVHTIKGGVERSDSVLNALNYLRAMNVSPDHWVLVHDAARPCVRLSSIARLRQQVEQSGAVGGILAKPVADTLKRVTGERIQTTLDRNQLWQAQTPQMFRLGALRQALQNALQKGLIITDEASAMEQQDGQPLVVEDQRDNIKVTHPEDLPLAEMILQQQFD